MFSLLYFLYDELIQGLKIVMKGAGYSVLLNPIKAWVKGAPYYHMWYLYTLIDVYFLIPIIIKLKNDVGKKAFSRISWIFMLAAMMSAWTSSFQLDWGPAKCISYVGFLMVGYQLRFYFQDKKSNIRGVVFIIGGILTELLLSVIQYQHSMMGLAEADEKYSLVGNFNPLVVLASICIFCGFAQLDLNENQITSMASKTFLMYLLHAGVWNVLSQFVRATWDCRLVIPVCVGVVCVISYLLTFLYDSIWRACDKDRRITKWLCKRMRLE